MSRRQNKNVLSPIIMKRMATRNQFFASHKLNFDENPKMTEATRFLSNIPMGGESSRNNERINNNKNTLALDIHSEGIDSTNSNLRNPSISIELDNKDDGRQLRLKGNSNYVYIGLSDTENTKAGLRRWETSLVRQGFLEGRIYFSNSKCYPVSVVSIIQYRDAATIKESLLKKEKESDLEIHKYTSITGDYRNKGWRGISYASHLHAIWSNCSKNNDNKTLHPLAAIRPYNYDTFDDPEMRQGKHRTVMPLNGYIQTVIPFVNRKTLKEEINHQFRQRNPWVHPSITLSKIRALKAEALEMWKVMDLEFSTLALAYVYFEQLLFKDHVRKENRKLFFSVCIILAMKFNNTVVVTGIDTCYNNNNNSSNNDIVRLTSTSPTTTAGAATATAATTTNAVTAATTTTTGDTYTNISNNNVPMDVENNFESRPNRLSDVLSNLQLVMGISSKEILNHELEIFSLLDFSLHIPLDAVFFHFNTILRSMESNSREYLGDAMHEYHTLQIQGRNGLSSMSRFDINKRPVPSDTSSMCSEIISPASRKHDLDFLSDAEDSLVGSIATEDN